MDKETNILTRNWDRFPLLTRDEKTFSYGQLDKFIWKKFSISSLLKNSAAILAKIDKFPLLSRFAAFTGDASFTLPEIWNFSYSASDIIFLQLMDIASEQENFQETFRKKLWSLFSRIQDSGRKKHEQRKDTVGVLKKSVQHGLEKPAVRGKKGKKPAEDNIAAAELLKIEIQDRKETYSTDQDDIENTIFEVLTSSGNLVSKAIQETISESSSEKIFSRRNTVKKPAVFRTGSISETEHFKPVNVFSGRNIPERKETDQKNVPSVLSKFSGDMEKQGIKAGISGMDAGRISGYFGVSKQAEAETIIQKPDQAELIDLHMPETSSHGFLKRMQREVIEPGISGIPAADIIAGNRVFSAAGKAEKGRYSLRAKKFGSLTSAYDFSAVPLFIPEIERFKETSTETNEKTREISNILKQAEEVSLSYLKLPSENIEPGFRGIPYYENPAQTIRKISLLQRKRAEKTKDSSITKTYDFKASPDMKQPPVFRSVSAKHPKNKPVAAKPDKEIISEKKVPAVNIQETGIVPQKSVTSIYPFHPEKEFVPVSEARLEVINRLTSLMAGHFPEAQARSLNLLAQDVIFEFLKAIGGEKEPSPEPQIRHKAGKPAKSAAKQAASAVKGTEAKQSVIKTISEVSGKVEKTPSAKRFLKEINRILPALRKMPGDQEKIGKKSLLSRTAELKQEGIHAGFSGMKAEKILAAIGSEVFGKESITSSYKYTPSLPRLMSYEKPYQTHAGLIKSETDQTVSDLPETAEKTGEGTRPVSAGQNISLTSIYRFFPETVSHKEKSGEESLLISGRYLPENIMQEGVKYSGELALQSAFEYLQLLSGQPEAVESLKTGRISKPETTVPHVLTGKKQTLSGEKVPSERPHVKWPVKSLTSAYEFKPGLKIAEKPSSERIQPASLFRKIEDTDAELLTLPEIEKDAGTEYTDIKQSLVISQKALRKSMFGETPLIKSGMFGRGIPDEKEISRTKGTGPLSEKDEKKIPYLTEQGEFAYVSVSGTKEDHVTDPSIVQSYYFRPSMQEVSKSRKPAGRKQTAEKYSFEPETGADFIAVSSAETPAAQKEIEKQSIKRDAGKTEKPYSEFSLHADDGQFSTMQSYAGVSDFTQITLSGKEGREDIEEFETPESIFLSMKKLPEKERTAILLRGIKEYGKTGRSDSFVSNIVSRSGFELTGFPESGYSAGRMKTSPEQIEQNEFVSISGHAEKYGQPSEIRQSGRGFTGGKFETAAGMDKIDFSEGLSVSPVSQDLSKIISSATKTSSSEQMMSLVLPGVAAAGEMALRKADDRGAGKPSETRKPAAKTGDTGKKNVQAVVLESLAMEMAERIMRRLKIEKERRGLWI